MSKDNQILEEITSKEYEHGWAVDLETDSAPKGLDENIVTFISKKRTSPNGCSSGGSRHSGTGPR
jgi:Fe-S cluster assembly protein SufB